MVSISIESNGRLERTAIYYNGEQISKVKELLINIDEDGTFDSIIKLSLIHISEPTRPY